MAYLSSKKIINKNINLKNISQKDFRCTARIGSTFKIGGQFLAEVHVACLNLGFSKKKWSAPPADFVSCSDAHYLKKNEFEKT